jgi:cobalt-zinc-cadmium efflux system membrane fusion protein
MKKIFMKSNQIFAIAGISLMLACTANKKEEQKSVTSQAKQDSAIQNIVTLTGEQLKSANLSIGQVQNKDMHQILKVNGLIDVPPSNIVSISIPLGGYLKKTNLIPGMFVKKGALLAVIEDPIYIQLQQDYLTAKSRFAYLEADYIRQRDLNATKSTSDKIYQLAKSDFESQKYLETTISRAINFNSPINGYVTKVNVNIGKYVTPTDVLFEIVDPSDLHLRLIVYENDVLNLKIGNEVTFTTNNDLSKKHTAHVAVITPNINEERTTDVHCHLVNENVRLYPGTYVSAEISLNNAKVDALPEESIVKWENKPFIFVKQPDQSYKLVAVALGVTTNGFIEVKTNLQGQDIVLKNAYTLLMKLKNSSEE